MTTKAQEREILAKIEKLIASAGPDSYIATAFTGCVELAADNIENDFAQNFPDRLHRLEHDTGVLSKAVDSMTAKIRNLEEEREGLRAELEATRKQRIPAGIYKRLWLAVETQESEAAAEQMKLADLLAEIAEMPDTTPDALRQTARAIASAKARRLEAGALLRALEKYEPENV